MHVPFGGEVIRSYAANQGNVVKMEKMWHMLKWLRDLYAYHKYAQTLLQTAVVSALGVLCKAFLFEGKKLNRQFGSLCWDSVMKAVIKNYKHLLTIRITQDKDSVKKPEYWVFLN